MQPNGAARVPIAKTLHESTQTSEPLIKSQP